MIHTSGAGTDVARIWLVAVWSRLSSTTARYSSCVPRSSPLMSWNTWYGALSSVPTACHGSFPTFASNVTS